VAQRAGDAARGLGSGARGQLGGERREVLVPRREPRRRGDAERAAEPRVGVLDERERRRAGLTGRLLAVRGARDEREARTRRAGLLGLGEAPAAALELLLARCRAP
jgi:hypothetical protein